jgi:hypothetical protein
MTKSTPIPLFVLKDGMNEEACGRLMECLFSDKANMMGEALLREEAQLRQDTISASKDETVTPEIRAAFKKFEQHQYQSQDSLKPTANQPLGRRDKVAEGHGFFGLLHFSFASLRSLWREYETYGEGIFSGSATRVASAFLVISMIYAIDNAPNIGATVTHETTNLFTGLSPHNVSSVWISLAMVAGLFAGVCYRFPSAAGAFAVLTLGTVATVGLLATLGLLSMSLDDLVAQLESFIGKYNIEAIEAAVFGWAVASTALLVYLHGRRHEGREKHSLTALMVRLLLAFWSSVGHSSVDEGDSSGARYRL